MNCFETRNEFPALWRKTATVERRAELMAHLTSCTKCDHAFRVFALTAPVLHSETEPAENIGAALNGKRESFAYDRPRRIGSVSRVENGSRRWLAMAAAAVIFVFASSAAYFSDRPSTETLNEALSTSEVVPSSEAAADPFAPEIPTTESDLAS